MNSTAGDTNELETLRVKSTNEDWIYAKKQFFLVGN